MLVPITVHRAYHARADPSHDPPATVTGIATFGVLTPTNAGSSSLGTRVPVPA